MLAKLAFFLDLSGMIDKKKTILSSRSKRLFWKIAEVDLWEDVDMGDLEVDHDAEGGHGARDEFAPVHHEVGVDQKHSTHSKAWQYF